MKQSNYLGSNKLKLLLSVMGVVFTVSSCGGSSGSSNGGGGSTPVTVATPITIDSAGVVPILESSPTTSVIYVHNNSSADIQQIKYTTRNNSILGSNVAVSGCDSISAGGVCPLTFTTPTLESTETTGSIVITATYLQGQVQKTFEQIVSYAKVDSSLTPGVVFTSEALAAGFGNSSGYTTLYMYGGQESGYGDVTYLVSNIVASDPRLVIVQGSVSSISTNQIQPVEIMSNNNVESDFSAIVEVSSQSSSSGNPYNSPVNMNVISVSSGSFLISGNIPGISSSIATPSGEMFVLNAGQQRADITNISYPIGVTPISTESGACAAGESLNSYTSCFIPFTVVNGTSGSGNISVVYSSGSIISSLNKSIQWFNSESAALQMSASPSALNFPVTSTAPTRVTVVNVGGYNMESVTIPNPVTSSGTAAATVSNLQCSAGGKSLPVGGTCTYDVSVSGNTVESGSISLSISANYNNGSPRVYTGTLTLGYSTYGGSPQMIVTASPNPTYFAINTSKVVRVTIRNTGSYAFSNVTSEDPIVSSGSAQASDSPFSCANLPVGGTCAYDITLTNASADSGTVRLIVSGNYSNNGILESLEASAILNYSTTFSGAVYVGNYLSKSVSAYTVNESGMLVANGRIVTGGINPTDMAVHPSGQFLYTLNDDQYNQVSAFRINESTGDLAAIGTYSNSETIGSPPRGLAIFPTGSMIYTTYDAPTSGSGSEQDMALFTVNLSNGVLTNQFVENISRSTNRAIIGTIPSGKQYLYTSDTEENFVCVRALDSSGYTAGDPSCYTAGGTNGQGMAITPNGQYLYEAQFNNGISIFAVDQNNGGLTLIDTIVSGGTGTTAIAVDRTGKWLYSTNQNSDNLGIFAIQPNGTLLSVGVQSTGGTRPYAIVSSPTESYVYVTNYSSNNVSAFNINESTGSLTLVGTLATESGPRSIAIR